MNDFKQKFGDELIKSNKMADKKAKIMEICKDYKSGSGENKFCHEIGGYEDSSQSLIYEITEKLSYKESKLICQELQVRFPELCRDRYKIG